MKKAINHKKIQKILNHWGVKIVGTAKDFSSRYQKNGIWIDAEGSSSRCFNASKWYNTDSINPELQESFSKLGYYSEWQDAGTIILWEDNIDELIKVYG